MAFKLFAIFLPPVSRVDFLPLLLYSVVFTTAAATIGYFIVSLFPTGVKVAPLCVVAPL